jgi:hypothetical protein
MAMRVLTTLHRLAETGAGPVKTLKGQEGEKRLRVGDFRVRFTEEAKMSSVSTLRRTARRPTAEPRFVRFCSTLQLIAASS